MFDFIIETLKELIIVMHSIVTAYGDHLHYCNHAHSGGAVVSDFAVSYGNIFC